MVASNNNFRVLTPDEAIEAHWRDAPPKHRAFMRKLVEIGVMTYFETPCGIYAEFHPDMDEFNARLAAVVAALRASGFKDCS